jgi:effector-binding domain-containing protein
MPSAYTLETLPQPKDSRIHFRQIPTRSVAAVRFSGYFQQDTINKRKQRLAEWLVESGYETEGDFIVAGYNPPWVPGFLARNEVMVQINAQSKEDQDAPG